MKIIEPDFNIELKSYRYLGRGPEASDSSGGWNRSNKIVYRCAKCGNIMPASQNDFYKCDCGAMYLDISSARFGSRYGDENILVYKKIK